MSDCVLTMSNCLFLSMKRLKIPPMGVECVELGNWVARGHFLLGKEFCCYAEHLLNSHSASFTYIYSSLNLL